MRNNTLNIKIRNKINLAIALILLGFIGLQYNLIAHDMKKNLIINNANKQANVHTANKFEFKPLPYQYDALEPFIDKLTVEIHYTKHNRAYYDNFLNAIKGSKLENMDIIDIFKNISKYPVAVRNNPINQMEESYATSLILSYFTTKNNL